MACAAFSGPPRISGQRRQPPSAAIWAATMVWLAALAWPVAWPAGDHLTHRLEDQAYTFSRRFSGPTTMITRVPLRAPNVPPAHRSVPASRPFPPRSATRPRRSSFDGRVVSRRSVGVRPFDDPLRAQTTFSTSVIRQVGETRIHPGGHLGRRKPRPRPFCRQLLHRLAAAVMPHHGKPLLLGCYGQLTCPSIQGPNISLGQHEQSFLIERSKVEKPRATSRELTFILTRELRVFSCRISRYFPLGILSRNYAVPRKSELTQEARVPAFCNGARRVVALQRISCPRRMGKR